MPKREAVYVGLILVAVPFLLQLLASAFCYLARDGATGAAIGVLSTTWLAIGLIDIVARLARPNSAFGLLLLATAGTLALSAVAIAVVKPLPALVFCCAAVRFLLAGIYQLTAATDWNRAAGVLGLVITGLAAYCVLAFELKGQQRRSVLPTLRRGRAAAAIRGDAVTQVGEVQHEAGVRQTT